jgi:hypothetical protein
LSIFSATCFPIFELLLNRATPFLKQTGAIQKILIKTRIGGTKPSLYQVYFSYCDIFLSILGEMLSK